MQPPLVERNHFLCVPPPLPIWSDLVFTHALVVSAHTAAQGP